MVEWIGVGHGASPDPAPRFALQQRREIATYFKTSPTAIRSQLERLEAGFANRQKEAI